MRVIPRSLLSKLVLLLCNTPGDPCGSPESSILILARPLPCSKTHKTLIGEIPNKTLYLILSNVISMYHFYLQYLFPLSLRNQQIV